MLLLFKINFFELKIRHTIRMSNRLDPYQASDQALNRLQDLYADDKCSTK